MLTIYGLSTFDGASDGRGAEKRSELDSRILQLLGGRVTASSDLAYQLGMPVGQISESLLRLELDGVAGKDGGGYFRISG